MFGAGMGVGVGSADAGEKKPTRTFVRVGLLCVRLRIYGVSSSKIAPTVVVRRQIDGATYSARRWIRDWYSFDVGFAQLLDHPPNLLSSLLGAGAVRVTLVSTG